MPLQEDGAIDQRVSVSESPEGMIGGYKGQRALCASAIRVDLRAISRGRVSSLEAETEEASLNINRDQSRSLHREAGEKSEC